MVQINSPNPFGLPDDDDTYQATLVELQRAGRFQVVTAAALRRALQVLRRDSALQQASGRWIVGRPDPAEFVPGDVAAIRKIVGATTVTKSALLDSVRRTWPALGGEVELSRRFTHTMLIELTSAVPYFIPATASGAVLLSRPPAPPLLEPLRLRLPFAQVLVLFGADLDLHPSRYPWPPRRPSSGRSHDLVGGMTSRGAYLTGMVLLADPDGRLQDDLIWIVAANPDPHCHCRRRWTGSAACCAAGAALPPWRPSSTPSLLRSPGVAGNPRHQPPTCRPPPTRASGASSPGATPSAPASDAATRSVSTSSTWNAA